MIADQESSKSVGLKWKAGGWFGAQIGGTCWIAICAALLSVHSIGLAGTVFAIFVVTNVVGLLIWRGRNRITAYKGMQALLLMIGVASLASVYVIDRSDFWHVVGGFGGAVAVWQMYVLIPVMVAALLWLFWSLNKAGRKRSRSP